MKIKYTNNKQFHSNEYKNKCNKVFKFCEEYNEFIDNSKQECLKVLKNNSILIDTKINIKKCDYVNENIFEDDIKLYKLYVYINYFYNVKDEDEIKRVNNVLYSFNNTNNKYQNIVLFLTNKNNY